MTKKCPAWRYAATTNFIMDQRVLSFDKTSSIAAMAIERASTSVVLRDGCLSEDSLLYELQLTGRLDGYFREKSKFEYPPLDKLAAAYYRGYWLGMDERDEEHQLFNRFD